MKKRHIFSIVFVLAFFFILCSCGDSDSSKENTTPSESQNDNNDENKEVYSVLFKDYDGKILKWGRYKEGEIPEFGKNPTRDKDDDYSYVFSGWTPEIAPVSSDIEYTANYDAIPLPYLVTIKLNGGESQATKLQFKTDVFTKDLLPFDVNKANFEFLGYALNGEQVFDQFGNAVKEFDLLDSMTFEAIYKEAAKLDIKYTLYNPKTNSLIETYLNSPDFVDNVSTSARYDYCSNVELVAKPVLGYDFVGWYENGNLLSRESTYTYLIWDTDCQIEARFKYSIYNLKVKSCNSMGQVMIKDGNSQEFYDEQTKEMYTTEEVKVMAHSNSEKAFIGWYDEDNNLLSMNMVYTFDMVNKDYEIIAKWDYFNISYNLPGDSNCDYGGINNTNNPNCYDTSMEPLELFNPSDRPGFIFIGWEYNGHIICEIDPNNKSDMVLTAKWKVYDELSNFKFSYLDGNITILTVLDKNKKSIIVPDCVTEIAKGAFYGCSSLESITLPFVGDKRHSSTDYNQYPLGYIFGDLEFTGSIEAYQAYIEDPNYDEKYKYFYIPESLKEIVITDCEYVQLGSFYDCKNIQKLQFLDKVKVIEWLAIDYCEKLTSCILPENLTHLGTDFNGCTSLTEIELPKTLLYLDGGYGYPDSLEAVYYDGSIVDWCNMYLGVNPMYRTENIYMIDSNGDVEFNGKRYSLLPKKLVLPNSISEIKYSTFAHFPLESITIPDCVTKIGEYVFADCLSLKNIIIPSSVISIGAYAFYGCSSLESITISNGVTSIDAAAFENCSSLTTITIPNSVDFIGFAAFSGCSSLESITLPFVGDKRHEPLDNNQHPFGYIFGTVSYTGSVKTRQSYYSSSNSTTSTDYYIPSTLTEVKILDCDYIHYGSFYNCKYLKNVTISNSTTIGDFALYGCSSLESIELPNGVTTIGSRAFSGCTLLESIELPNGVTTIGSGAFSGCTLLESITIPNSVFTIGSEAFLGCSSLKNIVIPNDVGSIGSGAFSGCSSLESITLPFVGDIRHDYLSYFQRPFGYIFGTKSYTGSLLVEQRIYDGEPQTYTQVNYYIPQKLREVTITNTDYIQYGAFLNCNNLESISLLDSVKEIGAFAFGYCTSLHELHLANSITSIGANACVGNSKSVNIYYDGTLEDWCNINFGDEYSNPMICANNFYVLDSNGTIQFEEEKYSLISKELIIPTSVTIIKKNSFAYFHFDKVVIHSGVTSIEECVFYGCNDIDFVLNGNSFSIAHYAFFNQSTTNNIYFGGNLDDWNNIEFLGEYANPILSNNNIYVLDDDGVIEYDGKKYSLVTE